MAKDFCISVLKFNPFRAGLSRFIFFRGLHPRLFILRPFRAAISCFILFRGLHPRLIILRPFRAGLSCFILPWASPTVIHITPFQGWAFLFHPSVGFTHGYSYYALSGFLSVKEVFGVDSIITSPHPHVSTFPHFQILKYPNTHIPTSPHPHIPTSPHFHIPTSPHLHIPKSPHFQINHIF